ncbi:hypothetical protein OG21DRAFT_1528314 [Imleria badia]|nr:hypothetical protein OG21DRAFT_1528314 [Imleria badia]
MSGSDLLACIVVVGKAVLVGCTLVHAECGYHSVETSILTLGHKARVDVARYERTSANEILCQWWVGLGGVVGSCGKVVREGCGLGDSDSWVGEGIWRGYGPDGGGDSGGEVVHDGVGLDGGTVMDDGVGPHGIGDSGGGSMVVQAGDGLSDVVGSGGSKIVRSSVRLCGVSDVSGGGNGDGCGDGADH